jgi:Tfp pilus assembly protein PilO
MALNLSLKKLPWYGQLGLFAGVAIAVDWRVSGTSTRSRRRRSIATRSAELKTMRGEIDRGLATAKQLPEFRRSVAVLQVELDRLRTVLPQERDVADLLRRVQGMATQSNLSILGLRAGRGDEGTARGMADRLSLEGTYHDLDRSSIA